MPNVTPWSCDTPLPAGTAWAVVTATSFVERGHCDYLLAYTHWTLDGGSSVVFNTAASSSKPPAQE